MTLPRQENSEAGGCRTQLAQFDRDGFAVQRHAIDLGRVRNVQRDLITLGNQIGNTSFQDLDTLWNHFKANNRDLGGLLYNGFKYLPSVQKIACESSMLDRLGKICGLGFPALIDINCRIDSEGEERFLFDWHQDYWFSVSSPDSVVVWIPVLALTHDLGGVSLISNVHTGNAIYKTRKGTSYHTYADAVVLDSEIPSAHALEFNELSEGDCLMFKFSTLHKSNKIQSKTRSRFTIQLRYADFCNREFKEHKFKPGIVSKDQIDYLDKGARK
jgi:hypothetical protein